MRGAMAYSESVEEYLKTICSLGGGWEPVAMSALAARLDISPVSAHEMIRKLAELDLVSYQPYKGVMLTQEGVEAANRVVRRHRLWERFLHDVLGLPWATVHQEAHRLEHATSLIVAEKLAEFLDNPESCPHGHPINEPGCDCPPAMETLALSDLAGAQRGVIVSVPEDDERVLRYVDELGLRPQTPVTVLDVMPLDGLVTIEVNGRPRTIGPRLASRIRVRSVA